MSNNGLTADGIKGFFEIVAFSSIRELDISKNPIGNTGSNYFVELFKHCHLLNTLNMSSCGLHSKGLDDVVNSLRRNKCLRKVLISDNDMELIQPSSLSALLLVNQTLKKLCLSGCRLNSRLG